MMYQYVKYSDGTEVVFSNIYIYIMTRNVLMFTLKDLLKMDLILLE